MNFARVNTKIINFFKKGSGPISRVALFVVFFWFGILKVGGLSPASDVVKNLFEATIPFISFDVFIVLFGLFECIIGIMFLFKKLDKITIPIFFIHMVTTFGPLVFLPNEAWGGFLTPTLEGQYIIKNLALIALVFNIGKEVK